jgi:hypothetical protein
VTVQLDLQNIVTGLLVFGGGVIIFFLKGIWSDFRSLVAESNAQKLAIAILTEWKTQAAPKIDTHDERLHKHGNTLQNHEVRIGKLEEDAVN